jgi:putative addiction module component (TIGR02574 family)
MTRTTEEVILEAMSLPPDARAIVADRLLMSLDSPRRKEIDILWAEEVERRVRQIETGEVKPIPGDNVNSDIF